MPTNPIGKKTKNINVNMPDFLPNDLRDIAIKLGKSRNKLIVEHLMLGIVTGTILETPEKWAEWQRENAE